MQFLYPSFLWALLALAIPVIIHLFYFRRFKKMPFTNVRFLKEIKEETSHRSRIKNLLVLAMRMLAFGALILAFCYPFFQNSAENIIGRRASSIFVDNSFSMTAKSSTVTLLEEAKAAAAQIIESHRDEDLIQILTHDLEGRHQRWMSKEDALTTLEEVKITPASRPINNILRRQEQLLSQAPNHQKQIYWISDFQKQMMSTLPEVDTTLQLYMLPLKSVEENNISLDSVWLAAPLAEVNESNPVLFKLTNRGNGNVENVRVSLEYQQETKPIGVVNLGAGKTKIDTFSLPVKGGGWQEALLKITDHPITFDDEYHIAFEVPDNLKVLTIAEQSPNSDLARALSTMKGISSIVQNKGQVTYDQFDDYNLIILEGLQQLSSGMATELKNYQNNGGNILFIPSANGDVVSYNTFFNTLNGPSFSIKKEGEREVSRINTEEFIFNNVFSKVTKNIRLPQVQMSYGWKSMGRSMVERLLTYRDGGTYLAKFTNGQGRLFVLNSPIQRQWNTLTQNAEIFIPMLYKMALSKSTLTPTSYVIGKDDLIPTPTIRLEGEQKLFLDGATEFIPGLQQKPNNSLLIVGDQVEEAGIYDLRKESELIRRLAFNHDRKESDMTFVDLAPWAEQQKNIELISAQNDVQLASLLQTQREGKSYWRLLLILSLIFLGVEQLLLRFWKT